MFTIVDLKRAMKDSSSTRNCRITVGEYLLSISYSDICYCHPCENVSSDKYEEVELALFKGNGETNDWVYSKSDLHTILGKYANLWAPAPEGCNTSVAGWVPLQVVCDIVNHLRGPEIVPVISKHTKGRCRRCGGYDDYIQDGDLCYHCCG